MNSSNKQPTIRRYQSSNQDSIKKGINFTWLVFAWSALATGLLFAFAFLTDTFKRAEYTSSFNEAAWNFTFWTILGHIGAFLIPIYILRRSFSKVTSTPLMALAIGCTVAVQIFWRDTSVGLRHLDCGDFCSTSIIPRSIDKTVTLYVLIALLVAGVFVLLRKPNKS